MERISVGGIMKSVSVGMDGELSTVCRWIWSLSFQVEAQVRWMCYLHAGGKVSLEQKVGEWGACKSDEGCQVSYLIELNRIPPLIYSDWEIE